MKSLVITVLDDVCAKNNKDPEATQLIEVARSYGKVEPLEVVVEEIKKSYQQTIDNLTAQLDAIKAHNLTPDELALLGAYRNCKASISGQFIARIGELENKLEAVNAEFEVTSADIIALLKKKQ